jgi:hypothetical protein
MAQSVERQLRETILGLFAQKLHPLQYKVPPNMHNPHWSDKRTDSDQEKAMRQAKSSMWLVDLASALSKLMTWPGCPELIVAIAEEFVSCHKNVSEREGGISEIGPIVVQKMGRRLGSEFRETCAEICSGCETQADVDSSTRETNLPSTAPPNASIASTARTIAVTFSVAGTDSVTAQDTVVNLTEKELSKLLGWLSVHGSQTASRSGPSQGDASTAGGPEPSA